MKKRFLLSSIAICVALLPGCDKTSKTTTENTQIINAVKSTSESATAMEQAGFSAEQAKDNLTFAKNQYLKLIDHVANARHLDLKPECDNSDMICVPRSQERDEIHMEISEKWTNGFFPGVLWKLLSEKTYITDWKDGEEQTLFNTALYYQNTLFSEAKRGSTHDLGFILYDSFGEALNYDELSEDLAEKYETALNIGRDTLATRYDDSVGLIRSWDWIPRMKIPTLENGEQKLELYHIANPWTYPVIVDNMMNLEFMFTSDKPEHHTIGFNHAKHTSENHYFYDGSDTEKKYPLSYHVFDYGSNKPGNWQGVGNISAWARGQGWSLYGFVTVVEAMENVAIDLSDYPDFKAHLFHLVDSIEYWYTKNPVPYWDYFATRENAYEYAENVSPDTTVFSGILGLCDKLLESHIKPYVGYRPMVLEASMLAKNTLAELEGKVNWHGEKIIQGDKFLPCGTKPYPDTHSKIPKDTSAAALVSAGLYRLAGITSDETEKQRVMSLADSIMAELTNKYRTDKEGTGKDSSLDLGFVLSEATGDMGNGRETDTPIIYGDFYFIEANILRIGLE